MAYQQDFIAKVASMAQADMQKSGVLASLTIAQAILESGWGKSGLTKQGNALFGIKADKYWNGKRMNCKTFEVYNGQTVNITDAFRAYENWEQSVADHSAFLKGVKLGNGKLRYQAVLGEKDYKKACVAIQKAGYATAPTYSSSLIKIIEDYKLYEYDNKESWYIWVGHFPLREQAEDAGKKILSDIKCYNEIRLDKKENKFYLWVGQFETYERAVLNGKKIKQNYNYYNEVREVK